MNLHHPHPRKLSNSSDKLTLPSISIMDDFLPTRSWVPPSISSLSSPPEKSLPTPPQPDQWKSPPYHNRNELSRDASYTYNSNLFPTQNTTSPQTSPSLQQSSYFQYTSKSYHTRVDGDIEEVVKQCNTLTDTMIQNKNQFIHASHDVSSTRPLLDDMIGRANQVLNALLRLRKHQIASEQQLTDKYQSSNPSTWRMGSSSSSLVNNHPHSHSHHSTSTTTATTTSNIRRKRGKRPAFQGRCHSCNISSTPEWRRGPDGARTLCNACGLHYAKLARKQQESRGMSSSSSILGHSNTTPRRSSHHSFSKLTPSPPPADDIILDRSPTG